jgi:ubiquinone/menaquinone biosynthesis C-methylase UbiE
MIHWLVQKIFSIQITIMLTFKPAVLFDKINRLDWYQKTLQQWVNGHKLDNEIKILEIGCATGSLSGYLSDCGYITTAVDISKTMLATAKSNSPKVAYYEADVTNLPFKEGEFDAVISASLINIISDQQTALEEMKRVCKQGGIISNLVPATGFSDRKLLNLVNTTGVSNFSEAALHAWHKLAPKMEALDLQSLLEKTGLTVVSNIDYLDGMVMSMTAIKE